VIPRDHILEWREKAPWPQDVQVEQDLAICRALVEMFSNLLLHDALAFRGGAALYQLHLPAARYSEDTVIQAQVGSRLAQVEATALIRIETDAKRSLGCGQHPVEEVLHEPIVGALVRLQASPADHAHLCETLVFPGECGQ
jgi:predicted nucleotidyltransferase component of viral defense system